MQFDNSAVWRLKIASEADAGALVRTLQFFQARSLTPRRVLAQRMSAEVLEIEIESRSDRSHAGSVSRHRRENQ